ncbi:MAG: hypothetical protein LBQ81_09715 [Zoogloeaceae bacterium]|jgi:hypothetical protein|nr:hypothetical protein [Zoogloeaceae bacterium]
MNAFLTLFLTLACCALVALDIRGISLASLARRVLLARRVRKNLGLRWSAAWAITGGRKC